MKATVPALLHRRRLATAIPVRKETGPSHRRSRSTAKVSLVHSGWVRNRAGSRSSLHCRTFQTFQRGRRLRSSGTNCSTDIKSPVDWAFRATPRSSERRTLSTRGGAQTGSHLATGIREGEGGTGSDPGTGPRPQRPEVKPPSCPRSWP